MGSQDYTLDIDATFTVAERWPVKMTYKGFKDYMSIFGHITKNALVLRNEFREGNGLPSTINFTS